MDNRQYLFNRRNRPAWGVLLICLSLTLPGLFDASDSVNRGSWRAYVERLNLKQNYPGIQGVGFSRIIQPAELQAYIAAIRAEGFPGYTVRPPGEIGYAGSPMQTSQFNSSHGQLS